VTNLLVNAQQAMQDMPPPRIIRISTRQAHGRIELEVADTGPGIPPEIRARVFEPFFTTKPVGLGTGIGLSVSRGIILAHQGSMEILDRPGPGASILISLPPAPVDMKEGLPGELPAVSRGSVRILVVDDEEDILEMLVETLERDGHEAVAVTSGRQALERLRTESFDLILSDLRMPDLDGAALLRELEEHRPELVQRLILMTGDVLGARLSGPAAGGDVPILEKPVQRDVLRREMAARHARSTDA
jgi:two-component system NtrC family sensor kinase